jgi:hypothetical protein
MSDMTDPDALNPVLRTCQIIVAAMIMGVAIFLVIIVVLLPNKPIVAEGPGAKGDAIPAFGGMQLITLAALGLGVSALIMSYVLPGVITANGRQQLRKKVPPTPRDASEDSRIYPAGDTGPLLAVYQNQLIVGSALNEGAAFFASIAYMLERSPIALGTALVLLAALLARIPTRDRLNAWLDRQLSQLQEERQAGP